MGRRARPLLASVGAVTLVVVGLAAGCTDGTTPDCSDAATQCGPTLVDGSADAADALDAARDTAAQDSSSDTGNDADLDAGDEG